MRPGGDHERVEPESSPIGHHLGRPAALELYPRDGRVLVNSSAMVLNRPSIGLRRSLRIGMTAEAEEEAADCVVADERYELLKLLAVELPAGEALILGHFREAAHALGLHIVECDANAMALILGRVAEHFVHLWQEALLFAKERAEDVRSTAAVAARGLPADNALVEHRNIHTRAREPPRRTEASDPAADDENGCASPIAHPVLSRCPSRSPVPIRRRTKALPPPNAGSSGWGC